MHFPNVTGISLEWVEEIQTTIYNGMPQSQSRISLGPFIAATSILKKSHARPNPVSECIPDMQCWLRSSNLLVHLAIAPIL